MFQHEKELRPGAIWSSMVVIPPNELGCRGTGFSANAESRRTVEEGAENMFNNADGDVRCELMARKLRLQ